MKTPIVDRLKQKYDPINYGLKSECPNEYLFERWENRISSGHYGFSLEGAPLIWGEIIDEFLQWLDIIAPNFEIQQFKVKFGRFRGYASLNLTDEKLKDEINKEFEELENWLSDDSLIY
jgi:hypothetical protein